MDYTFIHLMRAIAFRARSEKTGFNMDVVQVDDIVENAQRLVEQIKAKRREHDVHFNEGLDAAIALIGER